METNNALWFILLPLVACYPPAKVTTPDKQLSDYLHHHPDDYVHRYAEKGYGYEKRPDYVPQYAGDHEKRPAIIVLVKDKSEEVHDPYGKQPYYDGGKVQVTVKEDKVQHNPGYIPDSYSRYPKPHEAAIKPLYVTNGDLTGKDKEIVDHVLSGGYLKDKGSFGYRSGPVDAVDTKRYYGRDVLPSYGGYHDDDEDDDDSFDGFYPFSFGPDDYRRR